ncbi:MAG: glycerophosphodiester phosphodiesterase family protein [Bacteroidia bacterium]
MFRSILILLYFANLSGYAQEQKKFEVHGHRGFRGLFPENTLTAFEEAAKAGADYIEFDVVISKDSQVVVSHEPWFNSKTCSEPNGKQVTKRHQHNIYKLNYAEIKKFDCGKRGNKKFPQQAKIAEYKPLLSELIETMERYTKENNLPPIHYNLEIKCNKAGDGKYHPAPDVMAALVFNVIKKYNINDRILIQSFDTRSLNAIHKLNPDLKIGLLVANLRSVNRNIKKLGFSPAYYNPVFQFTGKKTIDHAHLRSCKIVVWTVDSEKKMKKLMKMGADGVITDYPDVALKLKNP